MLSEDPTTAIQVLLQSSKPALTFRSLSAHLNIPTRLAQTHLESHFLSNPTLTPLWCITHKTPSGTKKTLLTTDPTSLKNPFSKALWALATSPLPPTAPLSTWLSADRSRDHLHQAAPPSEINALRDGRYNPILSPTSVWRSAIPTAPPARKKSNGSTAASRSGSSLLASVKAKVKAREEQRRSNPKKGSTLFKSASTKGNAKGTTALAPNRAGNSLFSTKRLGADAAARIRAEDRNTAKTTENGSKPARRKGSSNAKKGRRVIADSDDDEEPAPMEEEEEEVDEEEKHIADMEREAEQREAEEAARAEAERTELQREVEELTRNDFEEEKAGKEDEEEEEPQSPELCEVGEKGADGVEGGSPSRTPESGKRKLNEAFGMPSVEQKGGRRIRKEVDETVEDERGYLVTRRVVKTFDENGNEVDDEVSEPPEKKATPPPKTAPNVKPLNPTNSASGKNAKKEKGKEVKRPSSKLGTNGSEKKSAKKRTKGKNIMSYFGKK